MTSGDRRIPIDAEPAPPGGAGGSLQILVVASTLILIGLLWLGGLWGLQTERTNSLDTARQNSANLARAFEEHSRLSLRALDQTLATVVRTYLAAPERFDADAALAEETVLAGVAERIFLIGPDGRLRGRGLPDADLGQADYFRAHAVPGPTAAFIAPPSADPVSGHDNVMVSRRVTLADGSFGGVMVLSVEPGYFVNFYKGIDVGRRGAVYLVGRDGIFRARVVGGVTEVGGDISSSPLFRMLEHSPTGSYVVDAHDGVRRTVSYRALGEYPMVVGVGLSVDEIMTEFSVMRRGVLAALAAVTLLAVAGLVHILRQIRHQERTEQILRRREVALQAATEAAEVASRSKSEFLSTMSHEIRTPLNGILGMAQVLLSSNLDERQKSYAETILSSGRSLLGLLSDVLDLSKIEAGRLELAEDALDLRDVVENSLATFAVTARTKGIDLGARFLPADPPKLLGDSGRLGQALMNLVGNAVKFTRGGRVLVVVRDTGPQSDGRHGLAIEVHDTGIGVPEHMRPRLFQPFVQADGSTTRRFGGTGLGLSIVSRLAGMMGGSVDYRPGEAGGSVFTLNLCLRPAGQEADEFVPILAGRKVLVADDDPDMADELAAAVQGWGGMVIRAATLFEVEALRAEADILVVDGGLAPSATPALFRGEGGIQPLVILTPRETDLVQAPQERAATILGRPIRRNQLSAVLLNTLAEGEGTDFSLASPPPHSSSAGALGERFAAARVLVAEDNDTNQMVMRSFLQRIGCRAEFVADGREAVEAVAKGGFDLVFMDCQMPEMDGYAATAAIREAERRRGTRHIPIIAITANAMRGDEVRCIEAGMDAYIAKPCYLEDIEAAMILWLDHASPADMAAPPARPVVPPPPPPPPPSPAGAASESVPDLDQTTFERLRADIGDLSPLVARYDSMLDGQIAAILSAGADGDADRLRKAAHSLKGSSRSLGLARLGEACAELEHLGRAGDAAAAAPLLAGLPDCAQAARHALLAAQGKHGSPAV